MWCDVMLCDVMWCDVMWCYVMWCDMLCDVMWCDVMWCDVMWCDVIWCYAMWCYVMWCDMMLCDAMLCDVMWYDVIWYDCVIFNRISLSSYEETEVSWNSLMAEMKILSHFTLALIFLNIVLVLLFSSHLLAGLPWGRSPRNFPINLILNSACHASQHAQPVVASLVTQSKQF